MANQGKWRDDERYRAGGQEDPPYREHRGQSRDYGRSGREHGRSQYGGSSWEGYGNYGEDYSGGNYERETEGRPAHERRYGSEPYPGYGRYGYGREDRSQGDDYGSSRDYGSESYPGYGRYGYGRERAGYGRESYGGYSPERYEPHTESSYGRSGYRGGEERGWWDRASDEVSSWFGDEDAERRRQMDAFREGRHRGRGPKGYARSDERIREDVCDRLSDDPIVDPSDVEVQVSNCEVTLSGTVDSRAERRRAEDCAERVSGVTHVQNNLRVKQAPRDSAGTTTSTDTTRMQTASTTTPAGLSSKGRTGS
jgi:osmotically-inducible protein OsmY